MGGLLGWSILVFAPLVWAVPTSPKLCQSDCGTSVLMRWVSPDRDIDGSPLTNLTAHRVYYSNTAPFGIKSAWKDFVEIPGTLTGHSYEQEVQVPLEGVVYLTMTAMSGGEESGYSNVLVKINN